MVSGYFRLSYAGQPAALDTSLSVEVPPVQVNESNHHRTLVNIVA